MKLYGYWRSSSSWRVRIGLAMKEVSYEYVAVHLVNDGGEQHGAEYRERNPMRQVPLLQWVEGGQLRELSQSLAILEFLEELYPEPTLLPGGALERGRARQLAEVINSGTQPLQNLAVIQKLRDELGQDARGWSAYWIRRGLEAYEAMVGREEGPYSVGEAVSLADLCLIPQLYNARRFDVELGDLTRCLAIEEACMKLRAFQVSHPDEQPDGVV